MNEERSLSAWLANDGRIGECPDWYGILWMASKLQIPPWDVDPTDSMQVEWMERVKMAARAEKDAERQIANRTRACRIS